MSVGTARLAPPGSPLFKRSPPPDVVPALPDQWGNHATSGWAATSPLRSALEEGAGAGRSEWFAGGWFGWGRSGGCPCGQGVDTSPGVGLLAWEHRLHGADYLLHLSSLDGFVAGEDDSLDWLYELDPADQDFSEFLNGVGAFAMTPSSQVAVLWQPRSPKPGCSTASWSAWCRSCSPEGSRC